MDKNYNFDFSDTLSAFLNEGTSEEEAVAKFRRKYREAQQSKIKDEEIRKQRIEAARENMIGAIMEYINVLDLDATDEDKKILEKRLLATENMIEFSRSGGLGKMFAEMASQFGDLL